MMPRQNRIKQIALKLRAAAWNFTALTDELLNILEVTERDEALERLNGYERKNRNANPDEGGADGGV